MTVWRSCMCLALCSACDAVELEVLTILSLQQVFHQREANCIENLLLTRVRIKHVLEGVLGLEQREAILKTSSLSLGR